MNNSCLSKKPNEVILWGIGDFAKEYIHYLREASIEIKVCIDTYKYGTKFNNIKVIAPEEYNRKFKNYKDVPIVLTGRGINDEDRFEHICIYAVSHLNDDNAILLHPSFLADYMQLNYKGKTIINGFPGSGNILLKTIVDRLTGKVEKKNGKKERFFEKLAREHNKALTGFIDNFFYFNGIWQSSYYTQKINNVIYHAYKNKGFIEIPNLKSKKYLFEIIPLTHERPTDLFFCFMKRKNFVFFSAVRNPLDVIVSNSFKLDNTIMSMEKGRDSDKSIDTFREFFGCSRIKDLEWFENFAILVKEYFEELLDTHTKTNVIKYETLISEPIVTIKEIANILQVGHNDDEIKELWSQIGFKPLIPNKKHFFRPGMGKWKEYFAKQHIDILKSLKYSKLLKELGYKEEIKSVNDMSECDNVITEDIGLYLALHEHSYHMLYGKKLIFTHKDFHCLENSNLKIFTDSTEFLNAANYLLSSKYFKKLSSSAGL